VRKYTSSGSSLLFERFVCVLGATAGELAISSSAEWTS